MFDFLKICGKGILAVVLSPVLLIILILYGLYGLGMFFVILIKTMVIDLRNLFSKKGTITDPFAELEEDRLAREILAKHEKAEQDPPVPEEQHFSQNIVYQQNFYGNANPNNCPPPPNPAYFNNQGQGLPYGQQPQIGNNAYPNPNNVNIPSPSNQIPFGNNNPYQNNTCQNNGYNNHQLENNERVINPPDDDRRNGGQQ